jgi:hypothetical protein
VQEYFDAYQLRLVGQLNAATAMPDSDDEIDEVAQDEEEQHVGNEWPQLADDCLPDDVDDERERLAPCTVFPLFSVRPLEVLRARDDQHNRYALLTVKRLALLYHVWEREEKPSEDVPLEERVFGALSVFARVLWDALTAYYAPPEGGGQLQKRVVYEPADADEAHQFLNARVGPEGAATTLKDLMQSESAVEKWLHCLCGGRRRDRLLAQGDEQSPFFFFYGGLDRLEENNGSQFVRRAPRCLPSPSPAALPLPFWEGSEPRCSSFLQRPDVPSGTRRRRCGSCCPTVCSGPWPQRRSRCNIASPSPITLARTRGRG